MVSFKKRKIILYILVYHPLLHQTMTFSLLKLTDTKANKPGGNLLHFVAMVSVVMMSLSLRHFK